VKVGSAALILHQVGIAADLPSGYHDTKNLDHRDFYDFLFKKQQSYQRIPTDRFNIDAWVILAARTKHSSKIE
jgi:hypothetical protein